MLEMLPLTSPLTLFNQLPVRRIRVLFVEQLVFELLMLVLIGLFEQFTAFGPRKDEEEGDEPAPPEPFEYIEED